MDEYCQRVICSLWQFTEQLKWHSIHQRGEDWGIALSIKSQNSSEEIQMAHSRSIGHTLWSLLAFPCMLYTLLRSLEAESDFLIEYCRAGTPEITTLYCFLWLKLQNGISLFCKNSGCFLFSSTHTVNTYYTPSYPLHTPLIFLLMILFPRDFYQ